MKSHIALYALLAAAGLAACQPAAAPANTSAASAAAPSAAAPASSAAAQPTSKTGETPTAFVTRLLAPYQLHGQEWASTDTDAADKAQQAFQKTYDAEFYDPALLKLVNDNGMLAANKSGGVDMDYDPFCQCQDTGATYSVVSGHPDGARYDVVVKSDDKEQGTWTFVLTDSGAGWRVYDVLDATGDLRVVLAQHNACLRAAKNETEGAKCVSS
ncbi:MAG TPA: hypothetical protein VN814_22930 [Caulobacteraceae bacterium]|nr:hypothetical protein [Caulobacteraceae bacterium]